LAGLHDVELAALAAAGQRAAFGELVRRHGSAVRGLLRRMGADASMADDLAQDAFLTAFERIAEFRGEGTFQAWVKRIGARLYVRRWRRGTRQALLEDAAGLDPPVELRGDADDRLDLEDALKTLPEAERVCVSLCFGAGFSHTEAAELLNAPLGTVKSHVKRGLDRLRARLAATGQAGRRVND
jgi:RNA polymerase sigma-70 factor (ECF subfamily)